jgi:hypothetical protein
VRKYIEILDNIPEEIDKVNISYNIVTVKTITEKILKRVKEVKMTYGGCQAIGVNAATKEVEIDQDFMDLAASIVSKG